MKGAHFLWIISFLAFIHKSVESVLKRHKSTSRHETFLEHSSVHALIAKMRAQWIQIPSHMTNYFYLPMQLLQGILSLLALLSFVWVVPPQTDPPVPLGALCKVKNIIVENISLKGVNLNVFYFCSLSLSFAICASPITLLTSPPPHPKKHMYQHEHCFQFLLGLL